MATEPSATLDNSAATSAWRLQPIFSSTCCNWDGTGYPQGRKGKDIPISARLMAVADVYDALICRRVYKAAMPHSLAVSIVVRGAGQHFDPVIVDAFVALQHEFVAIAERYADSDAELQMKEDSRRGALS